MASDSGDRKQTSTPDEARQKALTRKVMTWGGFTVGAVAIVWGAIDGSVPMLVIGALCFGVIDPPTAIKALKR